MCVYDVCTIGHMPYAVAHWLVWTWLASNLLKQTLQKQSRKHMASFREPWREEACQREFSTLVHIVFNSTHAV